MFTQTPNTEFFEENMEDFSPETWSIRIIIKKYVKSPFLTADIESREEESTTTKIGQKRRRND